MLKLKNMAEIQLAIRVFGCYSVQLSVSMHNLSQKCAVNLTFRGTSHKSELNHISK